jgi:hypothetical protein
LTMDAGFFSDTSVNFHCFTRRHFPEYSVLHSYRFANLKGFLNTKLLSASDVSLDLLEAALRQNCITAVTWKVIFKITVCSYSYILALSPKMLVCGINAVNLCSNQV